MKELLLEADEILDDGESAYQKLVAKMKSNPVFQSAARAAEKFGYYLHTAYISDIGVDIVLRPVLDYHPDIYVADEHQIKRGRAPFEIQTTSYGALDTDTYKEFLTGCNDAMELVNQLSQLDFNSLYDATQDPEFAKYYECLNESKEERHWTACSFDFQHDGDYDDEVIRAALDQALNRLNCKWTQYLSFVDVTKYNDDYKWSQCSFDFQNNGHYDEAVIRSAINKAVVKLDGDWTGYMNFEDVTDMYGNEFLEECANQLNESSAIDFTAERVNGKYKYYAVHPTLGYDLVLEETDGQWECMVFDNDNEIGYGEGADATKAVHTAIASVTRECMNEDLTDEEKQMKADLESRGFKVNNITTDKDGRVTIDFADGHTSVYYPIIIPED